MTITTLPPKKRASLGMLLAGLNTRRLVSLILFILLFALAVRVPVDTDMWWHLRSGEWMIQNHQVPLNDPFSLTRLNAPWIDQSWGSQLIMLGFYNGFGGHGQIGDGGSVGMAIYTALLATLGMLFVYLMCEGNEYLRAFVIILAAAAAAVFWSARPQMMSFLLSAVVLYLLYLFKRRKVDRLWLIPIMMIAWVNLHSGFAIGFILLFGSVAGEILGRIFDGKNPDVLTWRQIGKLILITIISIVALAVNPNTTQMWGYPFRTFGIGVLQSFIQEWASPDFHGRETWPFILLMLGTLAAAGLSSKRLDWTDLVLTCGIAFMSLYSGRNIATFAIVAAPVLCRHLNAFLEEHGWRLNPARRAHGLILYVNIFILVLVFLGAGLKVVATLTPRIMIEAQTKILPVKVANFLNKNNPPGPMFNTYNWGGYFIFATPQYQVFVDGRTDLYDDEILTQWINTETGKDWQATFTKYGIKLVVIEPNSGLAQVLRQHTDQWNISYEDDQAVVFTLREATTS